MDAAKAIAAAVFYEGDLWNMVYSRHDNVAAVPPEKGPADPDGSRPFPRPVQR